MKYRVIASILLVVVLSALAVLQDGSGSSTSPAASSSQNPSTGFSQDEAALKSLKIN